MIVRLELGFGLQPERSLAAPLFAKDQGRRGVGRAAEELTPRGMVHGGETAPFEDSIRLSVFLTEGIASDSMMLKKMIELHPRAASPYSRNALIVRLLLPNSVAEGNPSWLTVSSTGPYDAIDIEEP